MFLYENCIVGTSEIKYTSFRGSICEDFFLKYDEVRRVEWSRDHVHIITRDCREYNVCAYDKHERIMKIIEEQCELFEEQFESFDDEDI